MREKPVGVSAHPRRERRGLQPELLIEPPPYRL